MLNESGAIFRQIMAAATGNIKEPLGRTLIRFMNAARQENTEQAVQLLLPHSADYRLGMVFCTTLLIPSSEKTIRSVLQSEYLNNKSASDGDIEKAAKLVLCTESFRVVYNTVIESSPLLLAIKQGSVDEVRSLLQQLPREEAVRLIINRPQAAVLLIMNDAEYEEKLTDEIRRNYTLNDEQVTVITSTGLSKIIKHVISWITKYRVLFSCLLLAAARGSPELMTLLLEYITSSNIRFTSGHTILFIGYIIASHSSDQAVVAMTQILLERIPADIKQKVCIDLLIQCVCQSCK